MEDELKSICICLSEVAQDWITPEDVLTRQQAVKILRELGMSETVLQLQDNEVGLGTEFEYIALSGDRLIFATVESYDGKRSIGYMSL